MPSQEFFQRARELIKKYPDFAADLESLQSEFQVDVAPKQEEITDPKAVDFKGLQAYAEARGAVAFRLNGKPFFIIKDTKTTRGSWRLDQAAGGMELPRGSRRIKKTFWHAWQEALKLAHVKEAEAKMMIESQSESRDAVTAIMKGEDVGKVVDDILKNPVSEDSDEDEDEDEDGEDPGVPFESVEEYRRFYQMEKEDVAELVVGARRAGMDPTTPFDYYSSTDKKSARVLKNLLRLYGAPSKKFNLDASEWWVWSEKNAVRVISDGNDEILVFSMNENKTDGAAS